MRIAQALFYAFVVVVIVVAGAVAWAARYPEIEPAETSSQREFPAELVERGAILAAAGNCVSCHTPEGGPPLSGGVPVPTPFGTIHSTNITPHSETGIGEWSEEAFRRALREGVDREGRYLYPAFPYDHYTKLSDADVRAVYAYLVTRDPFAATAPANDLPFPLNLRLMVAGWNLLYLDRGPYQPDPNRSASWNRGAYLVEGLGHCGSCHTPRNQLGAEDEDRRFAGGFGEGWIGPALNGESPAPISWSAEQIAEYLGHDWQEHHGTPLGPMAEVADNLRQLPHDDLAAIGTYLASLQRSADDRSVEERVTAAEERSWSVDEIVSLPDDILEDRGALIFAGACATCHVRDGQIPSARPVPLGLSTAIAMDDPTNFLQVVVNGIHPRDGTDGPIMPAFGGMLDDAQIAALADYVRNHFTDQPLWTDVDGAIDDTRTGSGGS